MIRFQDLPSKSTPLNATNLNTNFDELKRNTDNLNTKVNGLNTTVTNLNNKVNNLSQLDTTVDSLNTKVGNLELLNTNEKNNLVGAINELRGNIFIDRLKRISLNDVHYHCLCGVDNSCSEWIGGYGFLICIPLNVGSQDCCQIGLSEGGRRSTRYFNGVSWSEWKDF